MSDFNNIPQPEDLRINTGEENIRKETTMDVTDKKCPNCAGTIEYDPDTLKMTCPYCGYMREIPRPEDAKDIEELDFESAKLRKSLDWGTSKKQIICKNCAAESLYDEADTAACCPFCGSTQVMPVDNDENVMAPQGVVPFEISNENAGKMFAKWLKSRFFAPKAAKESCRAENFQGLYLPFWTYDTDTTSSYDVKLGFDRREGDKTVTTWKHYRGVYQEFIDDQIVYASKKTKNQYINSVSTYDFTKLKPYSPEYIAGFAAERYTLGLDDGWTVAKDLIKTKLKQNLTRKLERDHNADHVSNLNMSTSYDNVTFKYILAPIWIANYKYLDKEYSFAVNGQTGKVAGSSPVSVIKVILTILAIIAIVGVVYYFTYN